MGSLSGGAPPVNPYLLVDKLIMGGPELFPCGLGVVAALAAVLRVRAFNGDASSVVESYDSLLVDAGDC